MTTMQVQLVAPDRMVWSGEAEMVIARTLEGEVGVLANHAPLLGVLAEAPVRIRPAEGDEIVAAVHGGFLSVGPDGVQVLAEIVELADEIDVTRARRALDESSATDDDDAAKAAVRRAKARLRAAGQDA